MQFQPKRGCTLKARVPLPTCTARWQILSVRPVWPSPCFQQPTCGTASSGRTHRTWTCTSGLVSRDANFPEILETGKIKTRRKKGDFLGNFETFEKLSNGYNGGVLAKPLRGSEMAALYRQSLLCKFFHIHFLYNRARFERCSVF